jgi:hypothetical protein
MRIAGAGRRRLAAAALVLGLAGCALPSPEGDGAASSSYQGGGYPGAGSGYTGIYGNSGDRVEYRGELPSGTYTESCRDMRVDRDRHRLEASCKGRDGRWRETRLDLRECDRNIVNNDGVLECRRQTETVRLPPGSYRDSCRDFAVDNNRHLAARCRKRNGDWRDAEIDFARCKNPIRNDDGRLVCS